MFKGSKNLLTSPNVRLSVHVEPKEPIIKSKNILKDNVSKKLLDKMPVSSVYFSTDYSKSAGNYIVDSNDNTILDLYSQIASIPIGYNNEYLKSLSNDKQMLTYLINRPALGILPPVDFRTLLEESALRIKPKGFDSVVTMMCGSCSVENAVKASFFKYYEKTLGKTDFSPEELSTCMLNIPPGCPELSVLSFEGAFHGRTFGSLSLTRSKPIHKIGLPLFDWPCAKFPDVKYPIDAPENLERNKKAVEKSLQDVRDKMAKWKQKNKPVACIIIEPIQCEGGDRFAPNYFFHQLQAICEEHGISLIIDEVQTGTGTTGQYWFHESFNMPTPPDFVTFSKRMQTGGFYLKKADMTDKPYRIFNTWMGEPSKLYLLKKIIEYIEKENLLKNVRDTGSYMVQELDKIAKETQKISSVRGAGFIIAMDVGDKPEHKDKLWKSMLERGVLTGVCGDMTIRLRPHLVFRKDPHANLFLEKFREALKDL